QARGKDFVSKLFQQDLTVITDYRQQADQMVRGAYPIAIGLDPVQLQTYQAEGAGKNVQPLDKDSPFGDGARISSNWGTLWAINRPANPTAQKVFVNWMLSKRGQESWVRESKGNSA